MSIEQALAALTAAVEANTAALKGAGGAAPTAAPEAEGGRKPGRPPKKEEPAAPKYTPKYDKSQMQAALNEVKEAKGVAEAKGLIKDVGKQDKMADIVDPEIIDKLTEAAKAMLGGDEDGGDDM